MHKPLVPKLTRLGEMRTAHRRITDASQELMALATHALEEWLNQQERIEELERRPTYDPRLEPLKPRLRVWISKRTRCQLGHDPGRLYCSPSNPEIRFDDNDQPYIEAECSTCQDLRHMFGEEEPSDG